MSTSSMSPYVKVREIGRGTYGTVYLGKRRTDDQVVAIKEVHKSRLLNVQSLRIEIEVMKKLKGHPNVLNLYDYYESPMLMGLVLELCEGGEIFDAITERGRLAESEAKWVAAQALSALAFCHENNICHRDIKPQNILLKRKVDSRTLLLDRQRGQRAVVCDFGVSKSYRKNERLRKLIGTTSYMAPEMFQRSYEGPEVDMYAMGVVLFQMMTGSKPFASVRDVQVNYARSLQSAFARRVDFWKTHPECASLIRVLLRERATDRPSAQRALSHPWFATRRGAGTTAEKDAGDCEIFSGKEGRLALSALRSAQKHRRFKRDFVMTLATRITSSSVLKGQDDGALVRAFRALDIDGDGFVTPSEVTTALGSRIGSAASREVAAMLVRHDLDGDGRFSYRELLVCALERAASNSTSRDDLGSLMRRAGVSESRIGHVLQEHSQHERVAGGSPRSPARRTGGLSGRTLRAAQRSSRRSSPAVSSSSSPAHRARQTTAAPERSARQIIRDAARLVEDYERADRVHRLGRMRAKLLARTSRIETEALRLLEGHPSCSGGDVAGLRRALRSVRELW